MMNMLVIAILFLTGCAYLNREERMNPDPIRRVALLRQNDYVECVRASVTYKEKRLQQKRWRMIAQFAVAPDGKVKDPSITNSDFEESAIHQCVINQISGLSFPAEKETVVYRQLLDLNPGSAP